MANASLSSFKKISPPLNDVKIDKASADTNALSILNFKNQPYLRYGNWIYQLNTNDDFDQVEWVKLLRVGGLANISCFEAWPEMNLFFVGTLSDGLYIFQRQAFSILELPNIESNVFYAQQPYGPDAALTSKGVLFPNGNISLQYLALTPESLLRTRDGHYFGNYSKNKEDAGIIELDSGIHPIK